MLLLFFACALKWVAFHQSRLKSGLSRRGFVERSLTDSTHKLHFWLKETGTEDPLIVLHGFGGDALWTWANNMPALAKDRPVLIPDMLWFGQSSSLAQPSLSAQVSALQLVIAELGWSKLDLIGVSYGGFVGLALTVQDPGIIDDLVLLDSPGGTFDEKQIPAMEKRLGVEALGDFFVPESPQDLQSLIDLFFYKPRPPLPSFILEETYNISFSRFHEEKRQLLTELPANRQWFEAYNGDWPRTLVLWGEHDPVFPVSLASVLATQMDAELHIFKRASHAPNVEYPREFERKVLGFLD